MCFWLKASNDVVLNDEKWMVSFWYGQIERLSASGCERNNLCDPSSKRMYASVCMPLFTPVTFAVSSKQTMSWGIAGVIVVSIMALLAFSEFSSLPHHLAGYYMWCLQLHLRQQYFEVHTDILSYPKQLKHNFSHLMTYTFLWCSFTTSQIRSKAPGHIVVTL